MTTQTRNGAIEKLNIGLSDENRSAVIRILNRVLADQHVVYVKTRNYHWNVVGPHFHDLHKLLEDQYDQLAEAIDETAERVRQLGGKATGTMTEFIAQATLAEQPGEYPDARRMLRNLLDDHEAIIRQLREDIDTTDEELDDMSTSDFLTQLAQDHEKMAWMLRAIVAGDHSLEA